MKVNNFFFLFYNDWYEFYIYIKKKKVNLFIKLMYRKLLLDLCDYIFFYLIFKYNKYGVFD